MESNLAYIAVGAHSRQRMILLGWYERYKHNQSKRNQRAMQNSMHKSVHTQDLLEFDSIQPM